MRSKFRKFIVGTVAASFVFVTMPIAEVSAQKNGKGRDRGGDRGGEQRKQRSNEQRGQRQEQRQQRSDNRGQQRQQRSNDQRGGQRQQQMQARQQPRHQQMQQQRQQRSNEKRGQQQMSDRRARQQQRNSDWSSRQQQDRSGRESRRQQQMSDRNSRQQQYSIDRESRRQQQMSVRNSRQQQRVSGALWQGFPRDNYRRGNDDNNKRKFRRNDNDRARWNRGNNGTPQWANRNYIRPAFNQYRQEVRRDDRNDRRWDRENRRAARDYSRYQRRANRSGWTANIFPSVNWNNRDDDRYSRRSNRSDRYYSAANNYYPYGGYNSPVYVVSQPYYNSGYSGYGQSYYPGRYSNSGYDGYYDDTYYGDDYGDDYGSNYYDDGYNDGGDWKSTLLRTVLSVVFGGSGDNYNDSYYAVDPAYAYSGNSPVYAPGGYYTSQPNWIYSPVTYDATPYSDSPYRSMIYADPYTRDITREALAAGYSQGFIDGQNAASYGYDDYSSPYGYAPTAYNSYSTSLAERQRYMCEGYELGRRDAMEDRDSYGIYDGGGNLDLVTALLGTVMAS